MHLTPREQEKLLIFTAAELARKRRARGLRLNHPEAVALITDEIFEEARAGKTYDAVVAHARSVLDASDVMEGVPEMIRSIHVDALFPDGARLVVVHQPIRNREE